MDQRIICWTSQVKAYNWLLALQGSCTPVLAAAGTIATHAVFLAVTGGERLCKLDLALRAEPLSEDLQDALPGLNEAALDSLRRIHDAGVLHGSAHSGSLFVRRNQVRACLSHWFQSPVAHCS